VQEGQALQVLDALLGRGRGDVVTVPVALSPLSGRAGGGGRAAHRDERDALPGGGRRVARAGAAARAVGGCGRGRGTRRRGGASSLGTPAASRTLWIEGAAQLPALVGQSRTDATGGRARPLKRVVPEQSTEVGDWVFFHLAQRALGTFRLCDDDLRVLRERLVRQSPVALLFAPWALRSRRELRDAFTCG
jgi:hypothetical protein